MGKKNNNKETVSKFLPNELLSNISDASDTCVWEGVEGLKGVVHDRLVGLKQVNEKVYVEGLTRCTKAVIKSAIKSDTRREHKRLLTDMMEEYGEDTYQKVLRKLKSKAEADELGVIKDLTSKRRR